MWLCSCSTSIIEEREISAHLNILTIRDRVYGDPLLRELARRAGLPEAPPKHGALAVVSAVAGVAGLLIAILAVFTKKDRPLSGVGRPRPDGE
jgi:hypothetical protein